jgi:hypothetical protein
MSTSKVPAIFAVAVADKMERERMGEGKGNQVKKGEGKREGRDRRKMRENCRAEVREKSWKHATVCSSCLHQELCKLNEQQSPRRMLKFTIARFIYRQRCRFFANVLFLYAKQLRSITHVKRTRCCARTRRDPDVACIVAQGKNCTSHCKRYSKTKRATVLLAEMEISCTLTRSEVCARMCVLK